MSMSKPHIDETILVGAAHLLRLRAKVIVTEQTAVVKQDGAKAISEQAIKTSCACVLAGSAIDQALRELAALEIEQSTEGSSNAQDRSPDQ